MDEVATLWTHDGYVGMATAREAMESFRSGMRDIGRGLIRVDIESRTVIQTGSFLDTGEHVRTCWVQDCSQWVTEDEAVTAALFWLGPYATPVEAAWLLQTLRQDSWVVRHSSSEWEIPAGTVALDEGIPDWSDYVRTAVASARTGRTPPWWKAAESLK